MRHALILLSTATALHAQRIPGAMLAMNEPHHHLAFEDSTLRVLRVRVDAHDTTLLHEHDPDKPLDCPAPPPKGRIPFSGAGVQPALASAQARVFL